MRRRRFYAPAGKVSGQAIGHIAVGKTAQGEINSRFPFFNISKMVIPYWLRAVWYHTISKVFSFISDLSGSTAATSAMPCDNVSTRVL